MPPPASSPSQLRHCHHLTPVWRSLRLRSFILDQWWLQTLSTTPKIWYLCFFPALRCRDASLLWSLMITERNLITKAAVISFSPLTQIHNPWFAAYSVGPSVKKYVGFPRPPGATPIRSLPAPWEGEGCLLCGLWVTAECHLVWTVEMGTLLSLTQLKLGGKLESADTWPGRNTV